LWQRFNISTVIVKVLIREYCDCIALLLFQLAYKAARKSTSGGHDRLKGDKCTRLPPRICHCSL